MSKSEKRSVWLVLRRILEINFLERAGTFAFRGLAMTVSANVFLASYDHAMVLVNACLLLSGAVSFFAYLLSAKFGERKVLTASSVSLPIFYLSALHGVSTGHEIPFFIGFLGVLGLGGVFQSSLVSILQNMTVVVAKYRLRLSKKLIFRLQLVGNSGIMLSLLVSPKLPFVMVFYIGFVFSLIQIPLVLSLSKRFFEDQPNGTAAVVKRSVLVVYARKNLTAKFVENSTASYSTWPLEKKYFWKVVLLTIGISPQMAIVAQMWTSWYVQAAAMDDIVFGFRLLPSQFLTINPILYIVCTGVFNDIVKKKYIPMSVQFLLATAFPTIGACIVVYFQLLMDQFGILPSVTWQTIPYIFSIAGDCWYFILIFEFIQDRMMQRTRIIAIAVANLRFLSGPALNVLISIAYRGKLMDNMIASASMGIASVFFIYFASRSISFKRSATGWPPSNRGVVQRVTHGVLLSNLGRHIGGQRSRL